MAKRNVLDGTFGFGAYAITEFAVLIREIVRISAIAVCSLKGKRKVRKNGTR